MQSKRRCRQNDYHRQLRSRLGNARYVTFLLPHFLILDGGDIGESYIFFHLIESNRISEITSRIGYFFVLIHLASVILQFVLYFKHRTQGVNDNGKN